MKIVSIYLGHNSSVSIAVNSEIKEVVEFERFINIKNAGSWGHSRINRPKETLSGILNYLMSKYNVKKFDLLLLNNMCAGLLMQGEFPTMDSILKFTKAETYKFCSHHHSHMTCAFYQSDYQEGWGVSFDGGGNDGNFNIYKCDRKKGVELVTRIDGYSLGCSYSRIAELCSDIREAPPGLVGDLIYPGKLMSLASYGVINHTWANIIKEWYKHPPYNTESFEKLKNDLGILDKIAGQDQFDLAASNQYVFESLFEELVSPYYEGKSHFFISGGCALNIVNNEKLKNKFNPILPVNPSDCGLSLGFLLDYLKPEKAFIPTYLGSPVWDSDNLMEYVNKYNGERYEFSDICDYLLEGKLIGVVNGRCELGPRALGNRSIICHASVKGMKDSINQKVKNREWFRPFAPVCLTHRAYDYFNIHPKHNHNWMSFCPTVRPEFRDQLSSITHIDGTARLQTFTMEDNPWLYFLLNVLETKTEIPVLLNTSFNIAGKPILNTYRDAIWMLENTELDAVIFEDYIIKK